MTAKIGLRGRRHPLHSLAIAALASSCIACGSGRPRSPLSDAGDAWKAELQEAPSSGSAYSIRYLVDSSELYLAFELGSSVSSSCEDLVNAGNGGVVWLLEVTVPSGPPATYEVVPPGEGPGEGDGGATVDLRRVDPQAISSVTVNAITGKVTVGSSPADMKAQNAGAHFTGSLEVGFPAEPTTPTHCFSFEGFSWDGGHGPVTWQCDCVDPSGEIVSACGDAGGPDSCCQPSGPAAVFLSTAFDAQPCIQLCASVVAAAQECPSQ